MSLPFILEGSSVPPSLRPSLTHTLSLSLFLSDQPSFSLSPSLLQDLCTFNFMTGRNGSSSSFVETVAGFTAGIVSTLCLHPLDLVKTRLQGTTDDLSPPHTISSCWLTATPIQLQSIGHHHLGLAVPYGSSAISSSMRVAVLPFIGV